MSPDSLPAKEEELRRRWSEYKMGVLLDKVKDAPVVADQRVSALSLTRLL